MLIEVEGVTAPAVTHAFVVGVSHYPFLDGPQMTDRASSSGWPTSAALPARPPRSRPGC